MKNCKGFTIIEAILTLTILALGATALLLLFHRTIAESDEMELTLKATLLAQEKLEQIIHDKKYQGYSHIIAANYPATEDLTGIGYPGYTRTTQIQEVRDTDLITPQSGTGYKRLTVSVANSGSQTVTLDTLVTDWRGGP